MDFFGERSTKNTNKPKISSRLVPWIEKYRPKTLDEVAHQTEVVTVLKKCLVNKDLPNLLLYGPPGTGKTSIILAVAHQLFGPLFRDRVLELNASDERGIQVIRDKVKKFAQIAVSTPTDYPGIPPLKLIILDEADSMTNPAQAALRRIMETELRTTRFCLTCNYITRIIDPITSRCAKFRFKVLEKDIAIDRLKYIASSENLNISEQHLLKMIELAQGDMRRAVTFLQSASMISTNEDSSTVINEDFINEVASIVPEKYLIEMMQFSKEKNIDSVHDLCKDLLLEGYSGIQLVRQLQEKLLGDEMIPDKNKAEILKSMGVMDARLVEGADEYLQLLSLGAKMVDQLA